MQWRSPCRSERVGGGHGTDGVWQRWAEDGLAVPIELVAGTGRSLEEMAAVTIYHNKH